MARKYSRVHRLLKILTLIQQGTGWNAPRLAEACNTSVRNVYRDLEMIEAAGIPCPFEAGAKGYRISRDVFLPPLELTLEESLALVSLVEQVAGRAQVPFIRPAAKAIAKVKGQLPPGMRKELDQLDQRIELHLAQAGGEESAQDVYEAVRSAIANGLELRCSYESLDSRQDGKKKAQVFAFRPYCLFFNQRNWYAVGHHGGRKEVRCLKLSRFSRCQATSRSYVIPGDFSLEEHLGQAWRMIPSGTIYEVELRFDAAFADTIADTQWHASQRITWEKDDSILFQCRVDGLDEIVWWVLSMGPHCTVLQPPELAQRVCQLAQAVTERYQQPALAPKA